MFSGLPYIPDIVRSGRSRRTDRHHRAGLRSFVAGIVQSGLSARRLYHQCPTGLHDVLQSGHIRRRFFGTIWPATSEPNSFSSPFDRYLLIRSESRLAERAPVLDERGGIGWAFLAAVKPPPAHRFAKLMNEHRTDLGKAESHLGGT
jgi:hypothetical protein